MLIFTFNFAAAHDDYYFYDNTDPDIIFFDYPDNVNYEIEVITGYKGEGTTYAADSEEVEENETLNYIFSPKLRSIVDSWKRPF
jgi:hypothetical protein